jgi:hypothetical protein
MGQSIYGMKSSFSATDSNLRINIEDLVVKYPDYKFPALKRLNGKVFKKEVLSHKYEWSERDLRPVKADVVSQIAANATQVNLSEAGVVNKDDVILNKRTGERCLVTAVAAGTLATIERAFQSTSAAIMIEGDEIVRLGPASAAGALADNAITTGADDLYNYTRIYEDTIEMDDGQYKGFIHGDETQADSAMRIQQELMESQHLDLFLGIRYKNAATKRTSSGGFKFFVDTYASENAIDFGGSGTWSSDTNVLNKFEDAVQAIALKMGNKPTIYATYEALRKVRLVQDDTVRSTRSDKARGIGVVDTLMTGMGELDIVQVIDRTGIMSDYIFLVDETNVGYKARKGRGWFMEEKPYAGDGHLWQTVGEYTIKVETPKSSLAYIHTLGL